MKQDESTMQTALDLLQTPSLDSTLPPPADTPPAAANAGGDDSNRDLNRSQETEGTHYYG